MKNFLNEKNTKLLITLIVTLLMFVIASLGYAKTTIKPAKKVKTETTIIKNDKIEISGILLQEKADKAEITILTSKETNAKKTAEGVYTIENAKLIGSLSPVVSNDLNSPIISITPKAKDSNVTIEIKLREKESYVSLKSNKGGIIFDITKKGNVASSSYLKDTVKTKSSSENEIDGAVAVSSDIVKSETKKDIKIEKDVEPANGDEAIKMIDKMQETRKYTGKKITFQVRNALITDVFNMIANTSGFNIVMTDDVKGTITMSLFNVPWDQVLDIILNSLKLGYEKNGNILRIVPLATLVSEQQSKVQAIKAKQSVEPMVVQFVSLSYADPKEMETIVKPYLTKSDVAGRNGTISIDVRTNSLIINDIPEKVEQCLQIVKVLDTQTPQILIEAKIVEATETFGRTLSGSFGWYRGKDASDSNNGYGFGSNGGPQKSWNISSITTGSSSGFAGNVQLASLIDSSLVRNLNAFIKLNENDGIVKVVQNPRIVVLNNKSANIKQGTKIPYTSTKVSNGVLVSEITFIEANVELNVTPQVTNDGSVNMKINITRAIPSTGANNSAPNIDNRDIKTEVLVQSGSTLVLGGIYSTQSDSTNEGIPFLRKIPLIGWFFGSERNTETKNELMMFITPRILNEKNAGFKG